jgi:hypothetical protein
MMGGKNPERIIKSKDHVLAYVLPYRHVCVCVCEAFTFTLFCHSPIKKIVVLNPRIDSEWSAQSNDGHT